MSINTYPPLKEKKKKNPGLLLLYFCPKLKSYS